MGYLFVYYVKLAVICTVTELITLYYYVIITFSIIPIRYFVLTSEKSTQKTNLHILRECYRESAITAGDHIHQYSDDR